MTRISLSQTPNFKQLPLPKKRKFCYLNEFPISRDAFLKLKKSHKKNHQRQAKIVEIVNYFVQKGKGICYTRNEKWLKILKKEGFNCCNSTFDKDIAKLRKLNLIFTNSWNKPQRVGGGKVRHIITPWDITKYQKDYIEALNKKGKGKPDNTKKSFYAYKEKIMHLNFPAKHNVPNFPPRPKITRRSDRNNTPYINIPPIIPLQGDGIANFSQKRVRKRKRPPKIKKTYEKIDETQLKTHYDMSSAIEKMCLQPQFTGREQQLKENFRIAYNIAYDRPMQWKKTPLHLAAHATLNGYKLNIMQSESESELESESEPEQYEYEMKEKKYYELYDHLKWGDRGCVDRPMPPRMQYQARELAQKLASAHGEKLEKLGYKIGKYDIRYSDLQAECTIKYNDPYVFAGMLGQCVERGWNDVVEYMKSKLWNHPN